MTGSPSGYRRRLTASRRWWRVAAGWHLVGLRGHSPAFYGQSATNRRARTGLRATHGRLRVFFFAARH